MRSFAKFALAIPALLMLTNASYAAFTFSISPIATVGFPGSAGSLNVIATSTTPSETFSVSSVTFNYTLNAATITTTSNVPIGSVQVATMAGNPFSTLSYSISAAAPVGAVDSFTLTLNGNEGSVVGAGTAFSLTTNTASITAVPEPSSLCLVGLVGAAVTSFRRRRK